MLQTIADICSAQNLLIGDYIDGHRVNVVDKTKHAGSVTVLCGDDNTVTYWFYNEELVVVRKVISPICSRGYLMEG